MTRDSIIDLADKWAEKKGAQYNLQKLYEITCVDVCKHNRFWWRKKFVTFNLSIGTKTYDLASISTTPALVETGIEEIIRWSLINPSGQPAPQPGQTPTVGLTPIFDDEAIFGMIENATNSQPGRYTMGVDALQTLRIDPPDQAYKTRLTFWAIPNFADDSSSTTVPLIPDWHHNIIAEGMAATILEYAYGLQDDKAKTMRATYEDHIIDLQMRPRFTTYYTQQFSSDEDAVRST